MIVYHLLFILLTAGGIILLANGKELEGIPPPSHFSSLLIYNHLSPFFPNLSNFLFIFATTFTNICFYDKLSDRRRGNARYKKERNDRVD